MKGMKFTFKSPVYGSATCDQYVEDPDNRVDFNSYGACELYRRSPDAARFLTENSENLKEYVPEELQDIVLEAVFGIDFIEDDELFLLTEIVTRRDICAEEISQIKEWVIGQLSDGWGESLEQTPFMKECVISSSVYFDEDSYTFETEETNSYANYYLHPWVHSGLWSLELVAEEVVDLDDIELPEQKLLDNITTTVESLKKQLSEIEELLARFK